MLKRVQGRLIATGVAAIVLTASCGSGDDKTADKAAGHDQAASPTASPFASPPTMAECRARLGAPCYTAKQLRTAYGVDTLGKAGTTGKGQTIAIFDFVGSPTAEKDLETFSKAMDLPAPNLQIIQRKLTTATPATFNPRNQSMSGTAMETTLDLQAAHAFAPDASLILMQIDLPSMQGTSPRYKPSEATSLLANAEVIAAAVQQLITQTSTDVISISYGLPEEQFNDSGRKKLIEFREIFAQAAQKGVTIMASTGDDGAAQPIGTHDRRIKTIDWPSSDPGVIGVGGTHLHLDEAGKRTEPDTVWNNSSEKGGGAGGGGLSRIFPRPTYQNAVKDITGERRGAPDISMSAAPNAGLLIYQSYQPQAGWTSIGGTSEAAPLFAGLVASAAQQAGRGLGEINPELYQLASGGTANGIVDVTEGRNGPDGYLARKGYDLATGWGTVDAAKFVPALAGKSASPSPSANG